MMDFCKKSFYTLFNTASTAFTLPKEDSADNHHRNTPLPVTDCGAGLNILANSTVPPKFDNVIDSSSLINIPVKSDQTETGLKVLNSGDTDKLASCTESLGFESCNERSLNNVLESSEKSRDDGKSRKFNKKNKELKRKSFPPPLSSFTDSGKPTFFLRPVRKNGRLKLNEVQINRPECLRASRENGRLRLHLVQSDQKKEGAITSTDAAGEKLSDGKVLKGWKFSTTNGGGGEDCRRVHEQRNMHGWAQQCVSIG